jgi:two-component system cell cycle response regulator CtrA
MNSHTLLQGVTVLLVEDDQLGQESLCALLSEHGASVTAAHDAEEGANLAEQIEPDVVLCDIGLPGMDGYYLIQRLREHELRHRLDPSLAIALTGMGSEVNRMRSVSEGFNHFMTKPARPDELIGLMRAAISAKG